jgi:hypothetical protein
MATPMVEVLGDVFEFAFKSGFLKGRVEDYESFKESGFEKIKSEFLSNGLAELAFVWEQLKGFVPFELGTLRRSLKIWDWDKPIKILCCFCSCLAIMRVPYTERALEM